jgi:hypothetical protein
MRGMLVRLPLLVALLLSTLLLAAGAAHGAPPIAGLDMLAFEEPLEAEAEEADNEGETDCDSAWGDADEGVLNEEEAEQICAEEDTEAQPATKPSGNKGENKGEHRVHKHKRTCRQKSPTRRRRCRRDRQDGGSNSRAHRDTTG